MVTIVCNILNIGIFFWFNYKSHILDYSSSILKTTSNLTWFRVMFIWVMRQII